MVKKEMKRSGSDRRKASGRRIKDDPGYTEPERRKEEDRRSGTERRTKP